MLHTLTLKIGALKRAVFLGLGFVVIVVVLGVRLVQVHVKRHATLRRKPLLRQPGAQPEDWAEEQHGGEEQRAELEGVDLQPVQQSFEIGGEERDKPVLRVRRRLVLH